MLKEFELLAEPIKTAETLAELKPPLMLMLKECFLSGGAPAVAKRGRPSHGKPAGVDTPSYFSRISAEAMAAPHKRGDPILDWMHINTTTEATRAAYKAFIAITDSALEKGKYDDRDGACSWQLLSDEAVPHCLKPCIMLT